ncbi:MAG: hypothetical protein LBG52_03660 [Candidatus Peribacteria bacterium]|jgi:hypothetical protein|nr:hypothetical protein [Candidatus Peribacteria bacterium]
MVRAKQNSYTLRKDSVSKVHFSGGLMEAHFIYNNIHTGEYAQKDVKIRENDATLGKDLYNLLDSYEGELKTYLEYRFTALWDNYDHLTKRTDILADTAEAPAEQQEAMSHKKETTVYALTMFQKMLQNLRDKEGSSWDNDEAEFNEMLKFVRNALSALESHTPTVETIQTQIVDPLKGKWKKFQTNNIKTFP